MANIQQGLNGEYYLVFANNSEREFFDNVFQGFTICCFGGYDNAYLLSVNKSRMDSKATEALASYRRDQRERLEKELEHLKLENGDLSKKIELLDRRKAKLAEIISSIKELATAGCL